MLNVIYDARSVSKNNNMGTFLFNVIDHLHQTSAEVKVSPAV